MDFLNNIPYKYNNISGIYKITNSINGHSYIGKSNNIRKRLLGHVYEAKNPNRRKNAVENAILKYGAQFFQIEIVEEIPKSDYDNIGSERERYWINYFKTFIDKDQYNLTSGGEGTCGYNCTEKERERRKEWAKNFMKTEEGKQHHTKMMHGLERMRLDPDYSRPPHTEEWKKQHSLDMTGNKNPMYGTHSNGIPVKCLETNIIYPSARQAEKETGIPHGSISMCCKGIYSQTHNTHWEYVLNITPQILIDDFELENYEEEWVF